MEVAKEVGAFLRLLDGAFGSGLGMSSNPLTAMLYNPCGYTLSDMQVARRQWVKDRHMCVLLILFVAVRRSVDRSFPDDIVDVIVRFFGNGSLAGSSVREGRRDS